jgi:glycerol-3-phosphate dehydrogenase
VRPGKGIHVYYDRPLTDVAIVTEAIDGRQVFVLPWHDLTVVGTTDDDYYGDLDAVVATVDESATSVRPPRASSPRSVGAGDRDLGRRPPHALRLGPARGRPPPRAPDRRSRGARRAGFYSMLGGKLASYGSSRRR